jgi:hypothetical protein
MDPTTAASAVAVLAQLAIVWLKEIRGQSARNEKDFSAWLQAHKFEQIAEMVGTRGVEVQDWLESLDGKLDVLEERLVTEIRNESEALVLALKNSTLTVRFAEPETPALSCAADLLLQDAVKKHAEGIRVSEYLNGTKVYFFPSGEPDVVPKFLTDVLQELVSQNLLEVQRDDSSFKSYRIRRLAHQRFVKESPCRD